LDWIEEAAELAKYNRLSYGHQPKIIRLSSHYPPHMVFGKRGAFIVPES